MKKYALGFVAGTVMILALNQFACGQVSPITCDIFKCQSFLDLVNTLSQMRVEVTEIRTDVGAIAQDVPYITERVVAIENKVDALAVEVQEIKSYFPITVEPDPTINARLDAIDAKLDILTRPEASMWAGSISEAVGIEFQLPVWIRGEALLRLDSFGLHVGFNISEIQLIGVYPGDLTSDWIDVDANEATPGDAIVGGYTGSGSPSIGSTGGILFVLRLKGLTAGNHVITLSQYVDGVANMNPSPLEISVTIE